MSQFTFQQECQALANAPSLFTGSSRSFEIFYPQLKFADAQPIDVLPHVFGKRMERLFSKLLQSSERYDILAENLQVISQGHTLGELDFLIHDREQAADLHVEMACKFYLYKPENNHRPLEPWVGPNQKDRLESKLEKFLQKQFPLLHHPTTTAQLQKLQLAGRDFDQQVYLPGLLFVPAGFSGRLELVNTRAVAGTYFSINSFIAQEWKNSSFCLPAKKNWLIPPEWNHEWQSFSKTADELEAWMAQKRSPMLWRKSADGRHERLFVTWW